MTTSPIWFGSKDQPLFGWIHLPERAKAGFVLCPAIGIEGSPGYRALTVLAEQLVASGFAVVRFDYTGTGDSAGDTTDVSDIDTWSNDIESAVHLMRDAGVSNIGLIGLRVGALLAGHVAPRVQVDALVLWDPCITGHRYLREQEILGAMVSGEAEIIFPSKTTDCIDIPSINLHRSLADSLAKLDLSKETGTLPASVLILNRPDRPLSAKMRQRLSTVKTEWTLAPDQYEFFESETPFMPRGTIDQIVEWCIRTFGHLGSVGSELRCPSSAWSSTALTSSQTQDVVVERPVSIEPSGLFGLLTEPLTTEIDVANDFPLRSVLLLNLGGDRRTGPSRLWVELGRSWARKGIRVLRIDLSGLGDSPPRPGVDRHLVYPPDAILDVIAAAQFLAPNDPSKVLLLGVCSGGYHAAEAALSLKSKAVWLINSAVPVASAFPSENQSSALTSSRQIVRRADPISRRFSRMSGLVNAAHWLLPDAAWWLMDRIGLYTYPIRAFDPLLHQGTEIFLMCGKVESVPFIDRGRRALRDRLGSGRLHLEVANVLDHGLMMAASRDEVTRRLNEYISKQLSVIDAGS